MDRGKHILKRKAKSDWGGRQDMGGENINERETKTHK